MDELKLYLTKTEYLRRNILQIKAFVGCEAVSRCERFIKEDDRLLSLGSSFLIKKYVGDVYVDKFGKPRADGVFFNVSHSRDIVGIAVGARHDVGLDIEKDVPDADFPVNVCISPGEAAALDKVGFLPLFVSKESLSKAEGRGLVGDIMQIPALPFDGEVIYLGKKYFRHTVKYDGYFISVSAENEDFTIKTEELFDVGQKNL